MLWRRGLFSRSGGYLSESVAYFSAMSAAGYSATTTEKNAVDKWIRKRKADGSWDKIDRAYLHIGNLAAQLICCKSLTSRVAVNSPTASSNGLTFNGTTNYARSDVALNALTNLTTTSAHAFSFYSIVGGGPSATILGGLVGSDRFYLHGSISA